MWITVLCKTLVREDLGEDTGSWAHTKNTLTRQLELSALITSKLISTHTSRTVWCSLRKRDKCKTSSLNFQMLRAQKIHTWECRWTWSAACCSFFISSAPVFSFIDERNGFLSCASSKLGADWGLLSLGRASPNLTTYCPASVKNCNQFSIAVSIAVSIVRTTALGHLTWDKRHLDSFHKYTIHVSNTVTFPVVLATSQAPTFSITLKSIGKENCINNSIKTSCLDVCSDLIAKPSPIAVNFCKDSSSFIFQGKCPVPKARVLHHWKLLVSVIAYVAQEITTTLLLTQELKNS